MPARRDFFGEKRKRFAGDLMGPMSPLPDNRVIKDDHVINQLTSLMKATRTVPVSMPSKSIEGLRLTAKEYEEFTIIARSEPGPNGLTFKQSLLEMFDQPGFISSTLTRQVELIKQRQRAYDDIARGQGPSKPGALEIRNPGFAMRLKLHRDRLASLRFGDN